MRHESSERLELPAAPGLPSALSNDRFARAPLPASAMDEAFADYLRIDPRHLRSAAGGQDRALVDTLAAHLDTLDRHREQLARLLQSIDAGARGELDS